MSQASRSCLSTFFVAVASAALSAGQDEMQVLISDFRNDSIVRFDYPSGQPFDHFVGAGISPLGNPTEMIVGPDGNVYASSSENNTVQYYDGQSGRLLGTFIVSGDGGLSGPRGLAFGPDGNLYVSSRDSHSILRYSGVDGSFIDVFVQPAAGGLLAPQGLAFGQDGNLYVASIGDGAVLSYDGSNGTLVAIVVPSGAFGLVNPHGVVFDSGGRLYVSGENSHNVVVVPFGGEPELLISQGTGGLSFPRQMAIGPDGALVVAISNSAVIASRFDRFSGEPLGVFALDGGLSESRFGIAFVHVVKDNCPADFDGDGSLTIFDFLAFQNAFDLGCP